MAFLSLSHGYFQSFLFPNSIHKLRIDGPPKLAELAANKTISITGGIRPRARESLRPRLVHYHEPCVGSVGFDVAGRPRGTPCVGKPRTYFAVRSPRRVSGQGFPVSLLKVLEHFDVKLLSATISLSLRFSSSSSLSCLASLAFMPPC